MSLLMDALKKAEQEKKEAARKLKESAPASLEENAEEQPAPADQATEVADADTERADSLSGQNLSLEPLDIPQSESFEPAGAAESPQPAGDAETPDQVPDGGESEDITISMQAETGQADTPAESAAAYEHTTRLELEPGDSTAEAEADQTFHGVDLQQTLSAGIYEDTVQGEPFIPQDETASAFDETLPGVTAAQLAQDIGTRDQPTPVAAQTVFTATNAIARPTAGFRWLLVSLAVLAVGSAGIFYYYTVTPVSRDIPSPLVAKGVETVLTSQDLERFESAGIHDTLRSREPGTTTTTAQPAVIGEATAEAAAEPAGTQGETGPDSTPIAATDTGTRLPDVPDMLPVRPTDDAAAGQPATPEEGQQDIAGGSLPPVIEAPESVLRISRSRRPAGESRQVSEAHSAYREGDLATAREKYQQAFEKSPDNRDVLLGLAAIAIRQGDRERALHIYNRLVSMNPLDNVARAAMLGLQPGSEPSAKISLIKYMLAETPDQPSLHFNLGRQYAGQSRWAEAQQAFFDAHRLDPANPDYAFNLAVSLDRLGKRRQALDFYRTAVELARQSPAGFDPATVAGRIEILAAGE